MNITLVCTSPLPVSAYDDKARMIWWLGKHLAAMGHRITVLVRKNTSCDFARVVVLNDKTALESQIPSDTDLVHFNDTAPDDLEIPHLITWHEPAQESQTFKPNTVFLSHAHAHACGGQVFVYPGVDFSEYAIPDLESKRMWFHFLGNASKAGRNVRGAIDLAERISARLHVIGGTRVNFRQGLRIPLSQSARFHGALSPDGRDTLLNGSKGMIFPVQWQEPFSYAVVESLFFGCPVFGTPHGALPEQLGKKVSKKHLTSHGVVDAFFSEYGCLTEKKEELLEALKNADDYDRAKCHEFALHHFSAARMAHDYFKLYEKVLHGIPLHDKAPEVIPSILNT